MANEQKRNESLDFDVPGNDNCLQSSRLRPTDRPRLLFQNLRIQSLGYPSSIRRLLGNYSPRLIPALHSIDGVLLEGESLLVLGRHGSGCSTFLKTSGACSSEFQMSGMLNGSHMHHLKSLMRTPNLTFFAGVSASNCQKSRGVISSNQSVQ